MPDANQDYATTIGPDCTFKGELSFEKGLRLQGKLEGKITTPGRLHVAKEAKVQADVDAGSIIEEKANFRPNKDRQAAAEKDQKAA